MGIFRQQRLPGALRSNNAKSYYNRIVHLVGILASRQQGLPASATRSMSLTLQLSGHVISTAFGLLLQSYGGLQDHPLMVCGQGKGSGPALWAVISYMIIENMPTVGHRVKLRYVVPLAVLSFVCYAFVSNTNVVQLGALVNEIGEEILAHFQEAVDRWEGDLHTTGRALIPSKSFWYLIDFRWTGKAWKYCSIDKMPGQISINNIDGQTGITPIGLEPSLAEIVLVSTFGWTVTTRRKKYLVSKVHELTEAVRTSMLEPNDTWYALTATIIKTLEYPMATTTLTESKWHMIVTPLLQVMLPKSKLARIFPHQLL